MTEPAVADLARFDNEIRRLWHNDQWHYALVDIVRTLTQSPNPNSYWSTLKQRLRAEGFEVLDEIVQLKLPGRDNRLRQTDTATRRVVLRIIQSIPSPFAEPFKQWLAALGDERIAELEEPERAARRMREQYRAQGFDDAWIEQRLRADVIRNDLTDEWQARGADGIHFAVLTNTISEGTFGVTVGDHRDLKQLPQRAHLRDHMSGLELALISLGEATTTELHRNRDAQGFEELARDARDGGAAAGRARHEVEATTGRPAVTSANHLAQIAASKKQKQVQPPAETAQQPNDNDPQQMSLFNETEPPQA